MQNAPRSERSGRDVRTIVRSENWYHFTGVYPVMAFNGDIDMEDEDFTEIPDATDDTIDYDS